MVYVFCHFLANPIKPMFFGDRSKFKKLEQMLKIFIICHWFTFT
jgi:hypothetical protein